MKKTKILLQLVVVFIIVSTLAFPTKVAAQSDYQKQDAALMIYNCGLGGITSGLGALINKKKNQPALPTFWRGFKYGSLGGMLNYSSKRINYLISGYIVDENGKKHNEEALLWAWPTKLVHAAGSSIMDNAAANKENVFLDYNIPIGFINLSVNLKDKVSIHPQLMPFSLISFIQIATNNIHLHSNEYINQNNKLLFKEILFLGTPYFSSSSTLDGLADGFTSREFSNSILFDSNKETSIYSGINRAHEHIHTLQTREYLVFNQYLNKPYTAIVSKSNKTMNFIAKYIYPDIPYFSLFYTIVPSSYSGRGTYYKNPFELEAEHFGSKSYVQP